MKHKTKGKAVLGSWGITKVVTIDDYNFNDRKKEFEKEIKRIKKVGYSASIIDVEIRY